jgi:hypothetical protein
MWVTDGFIYPSSSSRCFKKSGDASPARGPPQGFRPVKSLSLEPVPMRKMVTPRCSSWCGWCPRPIDESRWLRTQLSKQLLVRDWWPLGAAVSCDRISGGRINSLWCIGNPFSPPVRICWVFCGPRNIFSATPTCQQSQGQKYVNMSQLAAEHLPKLPLVHLNYKISIIRAKIRSKRVGIFSTEAVGALGLPSMPLVTWVV